MKAGAVDGIAKQARTGNAPAYRGRRASNPVVETFLSFPTSDMARSPEQIKPLDTALFARTEALVGHLPFNPHEDLGDEPVI